MRFARRSQLEENDIMRCRTVDEKNRNELNCMTVQKPLKRQVVCNEVRLVVNDQTQQVAYRVIDAPAPFAAERGFVDTYGIAAYRKGRKLCQIADITADRGSLERLVEICNRVRKKIVQTGQGYAIICAEKKSKYLPVCSCPIQDRGASERNPNDEMPILPIY